MNRIIISLMNNIRRVQFIVFSCASQSSKLSSNFYAYTTGVRAIHFVVLHEFRKGALMNHSTYGSLYLIAISLH